MEGVSRGVSKRVLAVLNQQEGCDEASGRALLSPPELETLYHEVGHA